MTDPGGLWLPEPYRRALPPPGDPLQQPVRSEIAANDNDPVGSVGPNVPVEGSASAQGGAAGGAGATLVMNPALQTAGAGGLQAAPWGGWPVGWETPWTGVGQMPGRLVDAVFMCIDLNARVVSDFPVTAERRGQRLQPGPGWLGNPQPGVYTHWGEFIGQVWWAMQSCGEAFVLATDWLATGFPAHMVMLPPHVVDVDMVGGVRRYRINGYPVGQELLHLRYRSWPEDPHGHGPLEVAGQRILAVATLSKYGADLARNGGIPWAVLKHKYKLREGQALELQQQWVAAAHSRMGAPAVLDDETDLLPVQTTPADMALSDQQKHAESRVATLLGVPPFLVGLPSGGDSMTYSNLTSLFDHHWRSMLKPVIRAIMAALSQWALPSGTDLRVHPDEYTRGTPTERAAYYTQMKAMDAITTEEIRAAEGLPVQVAEDGDLEDLEVVVGV